VILIGHSNSGGVALSLAATHPNRIAGLVLVDAIGADQLHSVTRVVLARGLDGLLELKLTISALHHVALNLLRHTRTFLHQVKVAARADLTGSAARVAVPTLVAWGRWDFTMPLRCARLMHAQIPHSALYVSATGSHEWLVTNSREFAHALNEWLSNARLVRSIPGPIR
jgi:pimeloyl-ACP methyl ester carboxylesterase